MTKPTHYLVPVPPAREQLIAIDTVVDEALKVPAYQFAPLIAETFLEAAPNSGQVSPKSQCRIVEILNLMLADEMDWGEAEAAIYEALGLEPVPLTVEGEN